MNRRNHRLVCHADFVLDTNVLSRATKESEYRKLANLVRRMTAREDYGKGWVPVTSLVELFSGGNSGKRTELLATFQRLYQEVRQGLKILPPLAVVIEGEWKEPRESRGLQSSKLEPEVQKAVESGSLDGTLLQEVRAEFVAWRDRYRDQYREKLLDWQKRCILDSAFRESVKQAINTFHPPAAFKASDDLAQHRLVEDGHQQPEAIEKALTNPERYLCTWTFALLARLSQFGQTLPSDVRAREFGGLAKVLKPDENDTVDAAIAAAGAACGLLITNDGGLIERVNFLHDRKLIRLQAVTVNDAARGWHPPNQTRAHQPEPS